MKFDRPASFYVEQVLQSIQEGEQNPLDILLSRVKMEKIIKGISDHPDIQNAIMTEFEKYGAKNFEYKGALLQQQEAGVKYDFSGCGDPVMDEYLKQETELKQKMAERTKFLKNIPASGIVDPETGSFIYPPAKSSKTIIKTTLK
nr:hypothetical protein [Odoribacter sp. OF09-27XD]